MVADQSKGIQALAITPPQVDAPRLCNAIARIVAARDKVGLQHNKACLVVRQPDKNPTEIAQLLAAAAPICTSLRLPLGVNVGGWSPAVWASALQAASLHPSLLAWWQIPERNPVSHWIGRVGGVVATSAHREEDVRTRLGQGLAHVAVVSPLFPTTSKPGAPLFGVDALSRCAGAFPGRVFALGGIDHRQVAEIMDSGAAGVAAISGIWGPDCAEFMRALAISVGRKRVDSATAPTS